MHTPTTPTSSFGGRQHSPARPINKHAHSDLPAHGLRAQLQSLLPRHALFRTRVQIHQVASVPLVHGEFAARWKFRNVQSQTGLLQRVKGRRNKKDEKGKGKEIEGPGADVPVDQSSLNSEDQNSNIPSVVVSGYTSPTSLHPPQLDFSRTNSSIAPSSSSNSQAGSSPHLSPNLHLTALPNNSTPASPSTANVSQYSTARGITPFYKLKEHSVAWNHSLDVVIKMDVDRETSDLLPNEFKVVVMQRVIPGDPDAPKNPRLGALYLDLSEYAGAGKEVTRSFLLSDTKMNATLKLTIYLEHVGGDTNYIAPPLPKAEILNGVIDLLENDVYLTRPRALDLWGPYHSQQELEMDLLGGMSIPQLQSAAAGKSRSKSRTRNRSRLGHSRVPSRGKNSLSAASRDAEDVDSDVDGYVDAENDTDTEEEPRYEVPFDVSRLPLAYGPKTTEMLIEAIFNPVRITHDDSTRNPFTYYVSPEEVKKEEEARKMRMRERETLSMHSGETTSSGHAASQENGNADVGRGRTRVGVKGWWSKKKHDSSSTATGPSRPGTPVPVR